MSGLLEPAFHDRYGPGFDENKVLIACAIEIKNGHYFNRRKKIVKELLVTANEECGEWVESLSKTIDRVIAAEKRLADASKSASGSVRRSADQLSSGLMKIEKTANFDRLGEYVALLERAEKALSSLSELDSSGKLERIAAALK